MEGANRSQPGFTECVVGKEWTRGQYIPVGGRKWLPPPDPPLRISRAWILVIRDWLPRAGPLSVCGLAGGPGQAWA